MTNTIERMFTDLKPLTREEYNMMARFTDPGHLNYPKDPHQTLQELYDRGYDPKRLDGQTVIERCHRQGLLTNAYIIWAADVDAIAAYCDRQHWFDPALLGCKILDFDFYSYKKAELEMRALGCDAGHAIVLATRRIKGGRKIMMMPASTAKLRNGGIKRFL